jgi:hypothetical protein
MYLFDNLPEFLFSHVIQTLKSNFGVSSQGVVRFVGLWVCGRVCACMRMRVRMRAPCQIFLVLRVVVLVEVCVFACRWVSVILHLGALGFI